MEREEKIQATIEASKEERMCGAFPCKEESGFRLAVDKINHNVKMEMAEDLLAAGISYDGVRRLLNISAEEEGE